MADENVEYKQKSITLRDKDIELIESKALNLSMWIRNQLEKEFPEHYDED